jgi:selenocysteine lyase/cysteine desulfurase
MNTLLRFRRAPATAPADPETLDIKAIRRHFAFPELGRIVTNNAASTQPPRELVALYQSLAPGYENVHRGQSSASQLMTAQFEAAYDTIAEFIGPPGRASIALYRNTTEAINSVMYSLPPEPLPLQHPGGGRPGRGRVSVRTTPRPRSTGSRSHPGCTTIRKVHTL